MSDTDEIPEPHGPCHDFWLFREGERQYADYWNLLGSKDAPIRILDDLMLYVSEPLQWVPTVIPAKKFSPYQGLNFYGPTVINQAGGERWHQICRGWARILSQGPEPLVLTKGWIVPAGEEEASWKANRFQTSRAEFVAILEQLADYGQQVATGEYFLLHLGI